MTCPKCGKNDCADSPCARCGHYLQFAPTTGSTLRKIDVQRAVNASCECGGKGPDDGCCAACEVWHRLQGRQIAWERKLIDASNYGGQRP